MFLKRGSVELVNEMLRERKSKQKNAHKDDLTNSFGHTLKKYTQTKTIEI